MFALCHSRFWEFRWPLHDSKKGNSNLASLKSNVETRWSPKSATKLWCCITLEGGMSTLGPPDFTDWKMLSSNRSVRNNYEWISNFRIPNFRTKVLGQIHYPRWWFGIFFMFTPIPGEFWSNLTSIFFRNGWFNHQRETPFIGGASSIFSEGEGPCARGGHTATCGN